MFLHFIRLFLDGGFVDFVPLSGIVEVRLSDSLIEFGYILEVIGQVRLEVVYFVTDIVNLKFQR